MAVTLLNLAADLETSLAAAASVGATTATLTSATDSDGVALPSGKYGFTIDGDNSAKEFIVCDLVGTALTGVLSISMQGASTSGFQNYHRIGATVTITDWAILSRMLNNLNATTGFDAGTPLKYDGQPVLSDPTAIPTVQYVIDTASGGPVSINATVIAGDAGENVSDGDWVYYNTTDGEWYKTDADDTTKCLNVQIGKARGAGTDGNAITGGIFIEGLETVGTYVAGTTYYIGNTAGALSTSAGTNSVVVGVGDANGDLLLRKTTPSQADALAGTTGTPSSTNPYMTRTDNRAGLQKSVTAGATINGATLPVPVYQNTTSNKYLACDGNDLATLKFQGFAISNSTDTNPIDIQTSGIVSGFSGLDEGVAYFVSDTVGTIQNSPGTYPVMVGVAISPTELLIQKGRRYASGTWQVSTSTTLAIDLGFRPSSVKVSATTSFSTDNMAMSNGGWTVYGGNDCVYGTIEGDTGAAQANLSNSLAWLLVRAGDGATLESGTVTSITSTGFTLSNTHNTGSATANIYWMAEGDF